MDSVHLKTSIFKQYCSLVATCWRYAAGERRIMVAFYILFVFANIMLMAEPYVLGQLINSLQTGEDNLLQSVVFWLSIYAGLTFMFWVFHGPARVMERKQAFRTMKKFNLRYFDMLAKLPLRWHHDHHTGNTMNRIGKASGSLYQFAENQYMYLQNIVRFVIVFIMIGWLNIYISLGLFLFTLAVFFMLTRFDKFLIRKIHSINEKQHIANSVFYDAVSNMANIVMFNLRRAFFKKIGHKIQDYYPPLRDEIYINEVKWCLMTLVMVLSHFIVLYVYIDYFLSRDLPLLLGNVVALFQYMLRLDSVFVAFAISYEQIVRFFTDLAAVEPIERDFEEIGMKDEGKPALDMQKGRIEFSGLSFSYQTGAPVFEDFHLDIQPGEKIGLIGTSGAGKTSLVHLLLRFYDAPDEMIAIDGQNIRDVSSESLRSAIAVIPQDTTLFEETLMENIRYGNLEATDADVIEAAKKAHAHEFISAIAGQYQAFVGERGVKLSGGQRQRIAIARAILKDAPILILDEATSALDSESERFIQDSLKALMRGKTVIAIAHRLSTISHLDRLVVMEDGRIVEEGAHKELLKKSGHYARLWAMQSGGFIVDVADE